jgi:membrane protease YdiL (CAAX protease family)
MHIPFGQISIIRITEAFVFSLFIGLDEESFDRGFVFGLLEKYGTWFPVLASSAIFGLEHFGNFLRGEQSFSYTLGQVVGAAGFGFVAAGLMLYSGSIFPSMLMHGIVDLPMQFEPKSVFVNSVKGNYNLTQLVVSLSINIIMGLVLILLSKNE